MESGFDGVKGWESSDEFGMDRIDSKWKIGIRKIGNRNRKKW